MEIDFWRRTWRSFVKYNQVWLQFGDLLQLCKRVVTKTRIFTKILPWKFLFPFLVKNEKKRYFFFQTMTDLWFNHSFYRYWGVLLKNIYHENLHSRGGYFVPQGVHHASVNTKILWRLITDFWYIKKVSNFLILCLRHS